MDNTIIFIIILSFMWIIIILSFITKKRGSIFHPYIFYNFMYSLYYPLGLILHYMAYKMGIEKLWFSSPYLVIKYSIVIFYYFLLFIFIFNITYLALKIFFSFGKVKFTYVKKLKFIINKKLILFISLFFCISVLLLIFYIKSIGLFLLNEGYILTQQIKAGRGIFKSIVYVFTFFFFSMVLLIIRIKINKKLGYILGFLLCVFLLITIGERKISVSIVIPLIIYDYLNFGFKIRNIMLSLIIGVLLISWGFIRGRGLLNVTPIYNFNFFVFIIGNYLGSYSHLEPLANIIDLHLHKEIFWSKIFIDYFYYNVPRFLSPNKPLVVGPQSIITPIFNLPEENLTVVPSSIGEAILAGGIIGLVIYGILHAIFIYFIERLIYKKAFTDINYFCLYSFILIYIIFAMNRSGFFVVTSELIMFILFGIIFLTEKYFFQLLNSCVKKG